MSNESNEMKDEKRIEIIQDALNHLDDDMIENVDRLRNPERQIQKFPWRRVMGVAASICLLVIGSYAWENQLGPFQNDSLKGMHGTEPDNAPGLDVEESQPEDMEKGTECEPEYDEVKGSEGNENTESIHTTEEDSILPVPPGEPGETVPDHYAPLGDAYHIKNNYIKVTMLPHKAWAEDMSVEDAISISREIGSKYHDKIDEFVDALCTTPRLCKTLDIGEPFSQDIYHLFFHRTDGEIVHIWIFSSNAYVYYDADKDFCIDIDTEVYDTIMKVLWMHW